MKLDLFDKAILKVLQKFGIPLSTRMIGIKARMSPITARIHLEKLRRNGKVFSKNFSIRKVGLLVPKNVPTKKETPILSKDTNATNATTHSPPTTNWKVI